MVRKPDDDCYIPSEEEIAAACARIQAGWTPLERRRRCVTKPLAPLTWIVTTDEGPVWEVQQWE